MRSCRNTLQSPAKNIPLIPKMFYQLVGFAVCAIKPPHRHSLPKSSRLKNVKLTCTASTCKGVAVRFPRSHNVVDSFTPNRSNVRPVTTTERVLQRSQRAPYASHSEKMCEIPITFMTEQTHLTARDNVANVVLRNAQLGSRPTDDRASN